MSWLSGLTKGLGKLLGVSNPLVTIGLSLAPSLFKIGGSAGKKAAGYEQQTAQLADWMRQQALNLPQPIAQAPRVWQSLAAQAMRAQVQAPPGVALPGANELLRAAMMARAQQATAMQELADDEALRNWLLQRAGMMSGVPNLYQALAQQYRQQQAGQLAGWGQLLSSILSRQEVTDPRMAAVQAMARFFRGR